MVSSACPQHTHSEVHMHNIIANLQAQVKQLMDMLQRRETSMEHLVKQHIEIAAQLQKQFDAMHAESIE